MKDVEIAAKDSSNQEAAVRLYTELQERKEKIPERIDELRANTRAEIEELEREIDDKTQRLSQLQSKRSAHDAIPDSTVSTLRSLEKDKQRKQELQESLMSRLSECRHLMENAKDAHKDHIRTNAENHRRTQARQNYTENNQDIEQRLDELQAKVRPIRNERDKLQDKLESATMDQLIEDAKPIARAFEPREFTGTEKRLAKAAQAVHDNPTASEIGVTFTPEMIDYIMYNTDRLDNHVLGPEVHSSTIEDFVNKAVEHEVRIDEIKEVIEQLNSRIDPLKEEIEEIKQNKQEEITSTKEEIMTMQEAERIVTDESQTALFTHIAELGPLLEKVKHPEPPVNEHLESIREHKRKIKSAEQEYGIRKQPVHDKIWLKLKYIEQTMGSLSQLSDVEEKKSELLNEVQGDYLPQSERDTVDREISQLKTTIPTLRETLDELQTQLEKQLDGEPDDKKITLHRRRIKAKKSRLKSVLWPSVTDEEGTKLSVEEAVTNASWLSSEQQATLRDALQDWADGEFDTWNSPSPDWL